MILRVIVRDPPAGVVFALQLGRDGLQPPVEAGPDRLVFEAELAVSVTPAGLHRFSGEAVQGPAAGRFLYLNSGQRAGEAASGWDRRAKVSLAGIDAELVASAQASGGVLQTEVAGANKDGGPCCATVPLIGGWRRP